MSYNFVKTEEEIYKLWNENNIFKKSLDKNKNNKNFVFYDGPPFATGSPHYGHILAGAIKDSICRHAQFKGFNVERVAGYDCHGLPIEYEIEKKLGIKNYDEIMKFGIKNYNDECRKIVMRCADDWKDTISRFGRWIDFDNDYKTMNVSYMESIWWCFKQMWEKNLVYQGFKVMPYSTACGTPLSNFEAKSNYKLVNEESIIVKFKDTEKDIFYLVWTTTPWTLPCNMALCVNSNIEYSLIEYEDTQYVVATNLIPDIFSNGKKKKVPSELIIINKLMGSQLKGKTYFPIFNYYDNDHTFKICCDDYVSSSSGTGIVHIAPAFGEDDFRVCVENKVVDHTGKGIRCPVDRNGCYTNPINDFIGKNVKECDKDLIDIIKKNNFLFKRMNTSHDYPYCWRSDTPLIYKAVSSWFVSVTSIKEDLLENSKKTNWVPDFIKNKRFHNWLEDARDWGVSRSRFWGTPIPIWTNGSEYYCVGSISELEKLSNMEHGSIKDLHRENIDSIEIISPNTGNKLKRIEDVFDCWFESGCMPFAHQHYPFSNKLNFPADFIAEGLDQTRGWFYTLLVVSTAIKNIPAFKNVIVNGLVLAEDGKKMSKRLKNYPDPKDVINKYGADSLRMYLLGSPVVKAEPLRFKEEGVADISKSILIPIYNSFSFYYEHKTKYEKENNVKFWIHNYDSDNIFDKWIQYKISSFKKILFLELDEYKLFNTTKLIVQFIDNLNNQYIKLNRDRIKGKESIEESQKSLSTLGKCIFDLSIILSSLLPYYCENLFLLIKKDTIYNSNELYKSIHLLDYTKLLISDSIHIDKFDKIDKLFEIIDLVRTLRGKNLINFKMPISNIIVASNDSNLENSITDILDHLKSESNVLNIEFKDISLFSKVLITPNKSTIGKDFKKDSTSIIKEVYKISQITNKLNINGNVFELNESHFNTERENQKIDNYDDIINDNNDLLIYLSLDQNENIMLKYYSNILSTNVQKFRKEINLRPWDKIIINFITESKTFIAAFNTHTKEIQNLIGYPVFINNKFNMTIFNTKSVNYDEDMNFDIHIYLANENEVKLG